MTWITASDDDKPILEEIEKQTDRGAALIAVAYLEERLVAGIKARIQNNDEIEDKVFNYSGPLGTLSAKIDMGFLIGIYDIELHKKLHAVRQIRNEFAHTPSPRDFNSQRIKALCGNASLSADIMLTDRATRQQIHLFYQPDGTAKTAFLNTIKFALMLLDLETKKLPLRKPAKSLLPSVSTKENHS